MKKTNDTKSSSKSSRLNSIRLVKFDNRSNTVYNTIMKKIKIILDTNILFTALRSSRGASFKLLSLIPSQLFSLSVSVPLVVEYEDVLKRSKNLEYLKNRDIDEFIDFIVSVAEHKKIHYLWHPFLKDPCDDMLVELAVASNADVIVTYNKKDFKNVAERFGVKIIDAKELLELIGELS